MYLGKLPALVDGGYDWVDARDVVKAAVMAIDKGTAGERYVLSGHWQNMRDLSRLVSASSHRKAQRISVPIWLAQIALPFLKLYCRMIGTEPLYSRDSLTILRTGHRNISNEKASREFGFNPRPLEQTLNDTFAWFKENGFLTD
jgi:dihydroflavonol-4-reductase